MSDLAHGTIGFSKTEIDTIYIFLMPFKNKQQHKPVGAVWIKATKLALYHWESFPSRLKNLSLGLGNRTGNTCLYQTLQIITSEILVLNKRHILLNINPDREVSTLRSHLVMEALCSVHCCWEYELPSASGSPTISQAKSPFSFFLRRLSSIQM